MVRTLKIKMKRTKPEAAPPLVPLLLPNDSIAQGFDPAYWRRSTMLSSRELNKYINEDQLSRYTAAQRKTFIRSCIVCSLYEAENSLPCTHMVHSCGNNVRNYQSLAQCLGKCKDQKHCNCCCRCQFCNGCNKLFTATNAGPFKGPYGKSRFCRVCRNCSKGCCKCLNCVVCGEKVQEQCVDSNKRKPHHARCCESSERIDVHGAKVLFLKRAPVFLAGTNFQKVRTRRFMSVETEVLQVSQPIQYPAFNKAMRDLHCSVVTEGTVPNGFEINSAPASGDMFSKEISGILGAVQRLDGQINIRCGTHVHVDARDFLYNDLVNLAYLYHRVEPAIFAMLPPWRRVSRFAVPCRSQLLKLALDGEKPILSVRDPELVAYYPPLANQTKRRPSIAVRIAESLYGSRSLKDQKFIHKNGNNQRLRYMSLNIHSWVFQRTLEFRHWPGSLDPVDLMMWPQLCAAILDAAKRLPISTNRASSSIDKLSAHPVEALMNVLAPSTKVATELRQWADQKIRLWSPDFDVWWPIAQVGGEERVLPFKDKSHEDLTLSFDVKNNAYTYIPNSYRANWEKEWLPPKQNDGRYAEIGDLYAIPDKGRLLYMKENTEPTTKKEDAFARHRNMILQQYGYAVPNLILTEDRR